jgi:protein involved in polysaccharide export with SLBB domain
MGRRKVIEPISDATARMRTVCRRRWLPILLLALGAGCAGKNPAPTSALTIPSPSEALGAGDVIEIVVYREPDLKGSYRIRGDGTIDFPLIGEVPVVGRTPREVEMVLEERLEAGFLVEAQVAIQVRERASQKVFVLGAVAKPGSFAYEAGMTVIQAISSAGGFDRMAATNSVTITRRADGRETAFQVKVGDIQSGAAANVFLQPGDIIYVKEAIF